MTKDYYQILEVPRNATPEEIKEAYRKLAMQYHPDRNPGKEEWASEKFKDINEAFSVLGDPEKRRQYDQLGTAGNANDIFGSPDTRATFEDLMKDFGSSGLGFDFLDHIFEDYLKEKGFSFYFSRGGKGVPDETFARGTLLQDVRYELTVSESEASQGTKRVLTRKGKRLEVKIPPGVKTGSIVKLSNARQITDGQPGDILVQIKVKTEEENPVDNPGIPVELTDSNFDKAVNKYPKLVVDCWAAWCPHCRKLAPVIDELARDYQGKIVFGKLEVEHNPTVASRYQVMSLPTLLIFKNGQLVDRKVGALPRNVLEDELRKYL